MSNLYANKTFLSQYMEHLNQYLMTYAKTEGFLVNRKAYVLNFDALPTYLSIKGEITAELPVYGVPTSISESKQIKQYPVLLN